MQIETINTNGQKLNDPEDQFTVSDVLLSENPSGSDCKRFTGRII